MKLRTDYNALVIVGGWNKYIFSPEWVSKFLLLEEELNVEYPLNYDGSPRVSSKEIRLMVHDNKLNFIARNTLPETFEKIQELALKTADYLPHTPVNAFGVNYIYDGMTTDKIEELLELGDNGAITDFGASLKNVQYRRCFDLQDRVLNFAITCNDSGVAFDFNFHFSISNLIEFKERISDNQMLDLKRLTVDFIREIYAIEVSEESKDE